MLTTLDLAVFGFGAVVLLAWLVFFFAGLKHSKMFEVLEEKEYPFKDIYFVGYAVLLIFKYQYKFPDNYIPLYFRYLAFNSFLHYKCKNYEICKPCKTTSAP